MGVVAELGRLSVGAWSPGGAGGGYIAAGSYLGASDTSFGSSAALELISVDIQRAKLIPVCDVPSSHKFCSIDWGLPSRSHPAGLIASGLADGTVRVFNAADLIRAPKGATDENTAVIFGGPSTTKKHTGPVRSLGFNPFIPTRLVTGGADGQVLVWELGNPATGPVVRPPAANPTASSAGPKEEVTATAWNCKVQNILAAGTSAGVLNVWDLNKRTQILSLRNPRGRLRCSALAWHPDIAYQIVMGCDEDESSGALLWDLRNASAPVMPYTHHGPNGVSAMSWCPQDSDLLLTSSKDSRTVAVSITSGEIITEAPQTANWNFDVKWSPRIPGMYLASSHDGTITVNSLMSKTTGPSVSSETANALAESFGEMAGDFQTTIQDQSPRAPETQKVIYNAGRPPKWLKKPVSVSFGFGGRKVAVTSKDAANVAVESFDESFPGLKDSCAKLDGMLMDLTADDPTPALKWCEQASADAEMPRDKMAWEALGMMFQQDCRRGILRYLGFELPPLDAGDDIAMPVYGLARSQPLAVPVRPSPLQVNEVSENKVDHVSEIDAITNGANAVTLNKAMTFDGPAPWEVSDAADNSANLNDSILDGDDTTNGASEVPQNKINGIAASEAKGRSFTGMSREQVDSVVKRSVIVGDFKTAVQACLHVGRTSDALIIAHAGGPDLWLETQAEYLSKASVSDGSNIVGAVAGPKDKMDAYICDAVEAGRDSWKEALAVLLTYAPADEISEVCTSLGQRLLVAQNRAAALFCFICAGNTRMAATVWMRDRPSTARSIAVMMADRIERLAALVQKVRLLTAASLLGTGEREIGAVRALDEVSGSVLCEYGALLASQGDSSLAVTYLNNLDPTYTCIYGSAELIQAQASECLAVEDSAAVPSYDVGGTAAPSYDAFGGNYTEPPYQYTGGQGYVGAGYGSVPTPQVGNAWGSAAPPPVPTPPPAYGATPSEGASYSSSLPPVRPQATATPPRPAGVFGSTAPTVERSAYDPSAAYAAAPTYGQDLYQAPPPPAPVPAATPQISSPTNPYVSSMPAAAPPPVPMTPTPLGGMTPPPPMPGTNFGMQPGMGTVDSNLGLQSQSMAAPPPPPPPTDTSAPPPMSYHAKARPGSGASLPPSAEVAVAEQRRTKPLSSSGTPGGPPRRSTSTSSSLSALGLDTVLLEKADVSKVPANQQVIVKSLRGAYMYALNQNQAPSYKKKMDDVNKKLGRLVAGLNAGLVEAPVVELLIEVGKSIEKGNYDQATAVVNTLTKQYWDQNSQWIRGLKRLIDCVLTGR